MRYLLFANNNAINHYSSPDFLSLQNDDILITMNHCAPIDFILKLELQNAVYHFCRRSFNKKIPYSGLHVADKFQKRFSKIYLWPHPESIKNENEKNIAISYISQHTTLSINNIEHMSGNGSSDKTKNIKTFLSNKYNQVNNMSTGLIVYSYISQIKNNNDSVVLVGFTHTMNNTKHNPEAEKEFIINEKELGLCETIELI